VKVIATKSQLKLFLNKHRHKNQSIGFVPTMGALHAGHLSLIQYSREQCDLTVCSIFVNPTQFNDSEDFKKYPRTIEADTLLLKEAGCDVLFVPDTEEMYNNTTPIHPNLQGLDRILEGEFRPGHFDGVVQIVYLLLQAVRPDYLFMGLKDYQQQLIVRKMIEAMDLPVQLKAMPILREPSGLAMSSRNTRLTAEQRHDSAVIYKILFLSAEAIRRGTDLKIVVDDASQELKKYECRLEYMAICDADSLKPISHYNPDIPTIILIAVWWGDVRLIDNMLV